MFENLSDKLDRALKVLKGQGKITEVNVSETLKEVRKALLDADVNYKVAKNFCDSVKEKALGQNVLTAVSPGQLMTKIVNDELTELMGGQRVDINLKGSPAVILMAGLQGSGKTTFSAKLANYLQGKGKQVLLVAADIYRPAAIEQLKVLGSQINTQVFTIEGSTDAVAIADAGVKHARSLGIQVVIIDTAGRLAVDEVLMKEISAIKAKVQPQEILFVVDAMTGQDAVNTAKAFNELLNFDGVILTKMDGDTRGGAALTIKAEVNKPIKFIGTGEKIENLDAFYPDRMAGRILGMGDVVSLVERAQAQFDEAEAVKLQEKMAKNKFDFEDFYSQIQQIKKMGNVKDLMGMIPGVGKAVKDIDMDNDSFKGIEAIIQSMTKAERSNPDLINPSRRRRLATGSGRGLEEVNKLMKQFDDMRKMMKMMNNKTAMANMMKRMPGMGKGM